MAFHGDLFSFPLPELLQWLDSSRKTGTLALASGAGERKLFLLAGQVVATSGLGLWGRLAQLLALGGLCEAPAALAALQAMHQAQDPEAALRERGVEPRHVRDLARDELFGVVADLTVASNGQFHWTEDTDRGGDEWAPADLGMRELLFEALRWVDEATDVERVLPNDSVVVRALVAPGPKHHPLHRALLAQCARPQSVGRLRLLMGGPRSTITRRLFDLVRQQQVVADGAPVVAADPVSDMLEKGAVLVREQQFDAAALVCAGLMASDPADRRVREFARLVHAEHVAALYAQLPPLAVPVLHALPEQFAALKPEERQVAAIVNGQWDVSTVVLASPIRELETLKVLARLVRMGLLELHGLGA